MSRARRERSVRDPWAAAPAEHSDRGPASPTTASGDGSRASLLPRRWRLSEQRHRKH
jgi:hypothetical protein